MKSCFVIAAPPLNTTAAVVKFEASVVLVSVTSPDAVRVVNAPLLAVVAPIVVLSSVLL